MSWKNIFFNTYFIVFEEYLKQNWCNHQYKGVLCSYIIFFFLNFHFKDFHLATKCGNEQIYQFQLIHSNQNHGKIDFNMWKMLFLIKLLENNCIFFKLFDFRFRFQNNWHSCEFIIISELVWFWIKVASFSFWHLHIFF